MEQIVDFLESLERYRRLGAAPPGGVRLTGPPGTGRTLLAHAIAGQADVPFVFLSAAEFAEMIGEGRGVRDLLARADESAAALIVVGPPDLEDRRKLLQVHVGSVPLADDVDLAELAGATPGMVVGDLRDLVSRAALVAERRSHSRVSRADFSDALETIVLGTAGQITMSPEDRYRWSG